jgi:hypothetical protein
MGTARQIFRNDTAHDMFIYLEPWAWRYRVRPGDEFELTFGLE